ncbi:hypothetical protein CCUS01_02426 [Colletotrichum cuscutae]|uniref:Uncharacterized protein n=1 Tax=Colletotrichum cuscutae TaxID=1209917 RepID=A0AAI9TXY6_9PEZI|nr:hypothetical protein CCUS01_02426 [Colletotrichum cuscutae]
MARAQGPRNLISRLPALSIAQIAPDPIRGSSGFPGPGTALVDTSNGIVGPAVADPSRTRTTISPARFRAIVTLQTVLGL